MHSLELNGVKESLPLGYGKLVAFSSLHEFEPILFETCDHGDCLNATFSQSEHLIVNIIPCDILLDCSVDPDQPSCFSLR